MKKNEKHKVLMMPKAQECKEKKMREAQSARKKK